MAIPEARDSLANAFSSAAPRLTNFSASAPELQASRNMICLFALMFLSNSRNSPPEIPLALQLAGSVICVTVRPSGAGPRDRSDRSGHAAATGAAGQQRCRRLRRRRRPAHDVPAVAGLAGRDRRPAGAGQLRLRRRRHQRARLDGRRRAQRQLRQPAPTPRWRSSPRRPTSSRCRPTRWRADRRYGSRPARARRSPAAAAAVSGGRLMRRNYAPGADPGICDAWWRSRGRTTRWPSGSSAGARRVARAAGTTVSLNVAPPTRTRSVIKNRALAAAYAGATASASRSSSRRPATR